MEGPVCPTGSSSIPSPPSQPARRFGRHAHLSEPPNAGGKANCVAPVTSESPKVTAGGLGPHVGRSEGTEEQNKVLRVLFPGPWLIFVPAQKACGS